MLPVLQRRGVVYTTSRFSDVNRRKRKPDGIDLRQKFAVSRHQLFLIHVVNLHHTVQHRLRQPAVR